MAVLTLHPWPGALPPPQQGVVLICTRHPAGASRAEARAQIREALRAVISQTLGLPPSALSFPHVPGQAPRVLITGRHEPGLSISHEEDISVAALHLCGPVGIDLMRVQDIPDWESVARDYLGPQTTLGLRQVAQEQRAQAFAQAWCLREATLKCAGRALEEWSGEPEADYRCFGLDLPPGLVGMLVLPVTPGRSH
ncbi:4'-phosphopantetheinyl transferase superfamily protein [Pseudomonas gingeri]|uniref:4'-phosphopantetheinyl transferase superfamily protein n=1 Tax=Pseudomonas gingeri TaxID=117681 RepID=A0A7Y7XJ59_9PSED|nr:4'-phosphopantetheinyl transferase superfamily protein [Pseudomonas gingeri]NWC00808.1 4'-phosphopantetheinyl transferase superfamily protein [Pseudomonas gingeri]